MKYFLSHGPKPQPTTFREAQRYGVANGRHRLVFANNKTIALNGTSLAELIGCARQYCEPAECYVDPEGPSVWIYEIPQ